MKKYALLIGNRYFRADSGFKPLQFTHNDVYKLQWILENNGYHTIPVLEQKNHQILAELQNLVDQLQPDDLLLIYYSGHGETFETYDGAHLYLAANNSLRTKLPGTAVNFHSMVDILENKFHENAIIILDCCHSGAAALRARGEGLNEPAPTLEDEIGKGLCLMTASSAEQQAKESDQYRHGIFTHYLIQGLTSGQADLDNDGIISPDDAYKYIHRQLKQRGYDQTPLFKSEMEGVLSLIPASESKPKRARDPKPAEPTHESKPAPKIVGLTEYVNDIPVTKMTSIPGGSFEMGAQPHDNNASDNEKPLHKVTIQPFLLGATTVTFEQYEAYCKATNRTLPEDESWGRKDRPVINVSWNDAQAYIQWLNQQTGREYRLPTEAEWEYACRAGTTTKYSWGDQFDSEYANNNRKKTMPVGTLKANPWGLFDMHGNVYEWCEDERHSNYEGAPTDGRAWVAGGSDARVLRGGSWNISTWLLRSSFRCYRGPSVRNYNVGFRVAQAV